MYPEPSELIAAFVTKFPFFRGLGLGVQRPRPFRYYHFIYNRQQKPKFSTQKPKCNTQNRNLEVLQVQKKKVALSVFQKRKYTARIHLLNTKQHNERNCNITFSKRLGYVVFILFYMNSLSIQAYKNYVTAWDDFILQVWKFLEIFVENWHLF